MVAFFVFLLFLLVFVLAIVWDGKRMSKQAKTDASDRAKPFPAEPIRQFKMGNVTGYLQGSHIPMFPDLTPEEIADAEKSALRDWDSK
jgi:hypothetical protein